MITKRISIINLTKRVKIREKQMKIKRSQLTRKMMMRAKKSRLMMRMKQIVSMGVLTVSIRDIDEGQLPCIWRVLVIRRST